MILRTAGFSHGKKLIGIIENMPSGVRVDEEAIRLALLLRRGGAERSQRQSVEKDEFEIISGVYDGKTTGANVAFEIPNLCPSAFSGSKTEVRAGHADYTGSVKYGVYPFVVAESASARITATNSLAGAFAETFLNGLGIGVYAFVNELGAVKAENFTEEDMIDAYKKPLYMPVNGEIAMEKITLCRLLNDTLGGEFTIIVRGLKAGFGSYNSARLSATLAYACMSVPSVKGFEVGDGFNYKRLTGSECVDKFNGKGRETNHAGGIEGGISNGEDIVLRCVVKPVPTCSGNRVFDLETKEHGEPSTMRADVCVVPSAAMIAKAQVMLALTEEIQKRLGGDKFDEVLSRYSLL